MDKIVGCKKNDAIFQFCMLYILKSVCLECKRRMSACVCVCLHVSACICVCLHVSASSYLTVSDSMLVHGVVWECA